MQEGNGTETTSRLMRGAMIVVAVAAILAWIAAGSADDAASSTEAAATAIDRSLALAESTAALASQVQGSIDALTVATGSAGEASTYTVKIAEEVRRLIETLEGVDGVETETATGVRDALGNIEATLLETAGGLNESNATLADLGPAVGAAAESLAAIPEQLRSAADEIDDADSGGSGAVWLWRIAIVLVGVVLMFLLATVDVLLRRGRTPVS